MATDSTTAYWQYRLGLVVHKGKPWIYFSKWDRDATGEWREITEKDAITLDGAEALGTVLAEYARKLRVLDKEGVVAMIGRGELEGGITIQGVEG